MTREFFLALENYINERLKIEINNISESVKFSESATDAVYEYSEVDRFISQRKKPPFNQVLFDFIDRSGSTDSEIYKKACIDRRLFSKIRANADYRPSKNTIIALALALELSKNDAIKLLCSAGYTLSDSDTFDLIIQFCLDKKIYNISEVNLALDYFSLKPLMGVEP